VVTSIEDAHRLDGRSGVEFYSGILIPGMVNAHCHIELSHMCGAIPSGGGFAAFAEGMRCDRNRLDEKERVAAADYRSAAMWHEGISAVGDICNSSSTFAMKRNSPIHYHNFMELFGLGSRNASHAEQLRDEAIKQQLTATVTPHSLYSLSDKAFVAAIDESPNTPLSIHFMESAAEVELFEGRGRLCEWYASEGLNADFIGRYSSPAERLVALVPPARELLLVHNCRLRQRDIDIITRHFTAPVTWVVCPRSNSYISDERPPIELLRRNSLRVAIGTDSLASNTDLSLAAEMISLPDVPLEELLFWATAGGAKALHIEDNYGSIEIGKRAGLVLLTGVDFDTMTLTSSARTTRIV
jgi:cytosine/adenosine deaminase-related metal-dependent hydrolase